MGQLQPATAATAVRLRVPPPFVLPVLAHLDGVDAHVPLGPSGGTTVVADTPDLALARWGVRLTHDGDAWRLWLPQHPAGAVSPTCHRLTTRPGTIPAVARRALGRLLGGREPVRVARLAVRREPAVLVGAAEEPLLQVSDEEVSVHTGRRLTARFREVVLTPGPAAPPGLLAAAEEVLRAAGALERDELPRSVRVLGPAARRPPDLPTAPTGDGARAAWGAAVHAATRDLLVADVHLRLDRTAAVAPPSLPAVDAAAGLATLLDTPDEVAVGLATLRGRVEDVAVQHARLAAVRDGAAGGAARGLLEVAERDRDAAVRRLHTHLDGPGHAAAVDGLRALVTAPGVDEAPGRSGVRGSVAARLGKRWTPLLGGLTPEVPAEAAELAGLAAGAAVAPGKQPARFATAARAAAAAARAHDDVQQVQRWLEDVAGELAPRDAFVAGRVAGTLLPGSQAAATAWAEALRRLDRPKATAWLERDAGEA